MMIMNGGVACEARGGTLLAKLTGEIDAACADDILERVLIEIAEVGARRIVVDLADVSFLDSSGIRLLVRAHQAAESIGSTLVVRGPRPGQRRVIEMVGVDRFLQLEP